VCIHGVFLLLALIGLVCRPSPKKPAYQGGQRKGSLEGRRARPPDESGLVEDDRAKTGSGAKTPETRKPKKWNDRVPHFTRSDGGAGGTGGLEA
jgi:hypothetical protein